MKLTLDQAIECIMRGETTEEYKKRIARLRRLWNERYELEESIEVLSDPEDYPRRIKKEKRLEKVLKLIEELS